MGDQPHPNAPNGLEGNDRADVKLRKSNQGRSASRPRSQGPWFAIFAFGSHPEAHNNAGLFVILTFLREAFLRVTVDFLPSISCICTML